LSDRLKVIACLEKPNMVTSESIANNGNCLDFDKVRKWLNSAESDAQIVFWGPEADIKTALETIQERCLMAFDHVPRETRKALSNGTTIFERVLPGADRMYPDTDSAPIPLSEEYITSLAQNLAIPVSARITQMKEWGIPPDAFHYLLKKNLVPLIERISDEFGFTHKAIGIFLGHTLKHLEGQKQPHKEFSPQKIYDLFSFIRFNQLDPAIAKPILSILMDYPKMDFTSILTSLKFKKRTQEELLAPVSFLVGKFREIRKSDDPSVTLNWLMGQIRNQALGNISMNEYSRLIEIQIAKEISE
jgi:glutamyl-tRNA(Gln) amidotransferase subunit E